MREGDILVRDDQSQPYFLYSRIYGEFYWDNSRTHYIKKHKIFSKIDSGCQI
jgi:hypothetical protein